MICSRRFRNSLDPKFRFNLPKKCSNVPAAIRSVNRFSSCWIMQFRSVVPTILNCCGRIRDLKPKLRSNADVHFVEFRKASEIYPITWEKLSIAWTSEQVRTMPWNIEIVKKTKPQYWIFWRMCFVKNKYRQRNKLQPKVTVTSSNLIASLQLRIDSRRIRNRSLLKLTMNSLMNTTSPEI